MSVIDLRPHTLSYRVTTDGYEDDNGDWHPGEQCWSESIECHAVPAGSANEITFADGKTSQYSYTIGRLDPDCREFKIGEEVMLNADGIDRFFQVKGFHRYPPFQSKIWV